MQRKTEAGAAPKVSEIAQMLIGVFAGKMFESHAVAGAPGFEPGNGGTKSRCLTTWRRPIGGSAERRFYTASAGGLQRRSHRDRHVEKDSRQPTCSRVRRRL